MQKHVQIRAQNNGSVSKSVSQTVLRLSFDGFAPGIVRLTHLEQVEQFFSYVAPKTGCPDTQNKNSVTPCHFYTKIIIILHEKSGVERNDHFTKLSLWVNLNLGAFGAQNDHFSRLSFYREGTVL